MSHSAKKFIAVLVLLWLPVFTGNALASSMVMQMPTGHCHDESMQMADMDMGDMDMSAHPTHDAEDSQNTGCNSCAVCHLACSGYLAVAHMDRFAIQTASREITPYLVGFHSHTSAPLLPPPLVRA